VVSFRVPAWLVASAVRLLLLWVHHHHVQLDVGMMLAECHLCL
jgi:hypothetical protein